MVIIRRPIRRLKDTFQYTRPYDEIRQQQQRITGRRVFATKKLRYLPSTRVFASSDSNYNMNFNEIPLPPPLLPSFISKEHQANNDGHDLQQSRIKNLVIDELKSFFVSRNENHRQQYDNINSEINMPLEASTSTEKYPIQQPKHVHCIPLKKKTVQRTVELKRSINNKEQLTKVIASQTSQNSERLLSTFVTARTTCFVSISLLANILLHSDFIRSSRKFSCLLNLLSNTLFYTTSFAFGYFGAQYIRPTQLSYIHRFGNILTQSLLLHTCFALLGSDKSCLQQQRTLSVLNRNKTISNRFFPIRQDISTRIITSILHLIAGFTIHFDDKNTI